MISQGVGWRLVGSFNMDRERTGQPAYATSLTRARFGHDAPNPAPSRPNASVPHAGECARSKLPPLCALDGGR